MINLLPMAGHGNRFFQNQYRVPKPFIPIMGEPMFVTVSRSFPQADKYIFIFKSDDYQRYNLEKVINKNFSNNDIILLDKVTEGQACTCLTAQEKLDPEQGVFIASCDYEMVYDRAAYAKLLADEEIDVIIWTFKIGSLKTANPAAFAYCRTEGDRVVEVVEKRTISENPHLDPAVVGSFTYKRARHFVEGTKRMIEKDIRVNNEFYVGTSINQLIEQGVKVVAFEIDKFISFGNPFELKIFQYWQEYFDLLDDHPYSTASSLKSPYRF